MTLTKTVTRTLADALEGVEGMSLNISVVAGAQGPFLRVIVTYPEGSSGTIEGAEIPAGAPTPCVNILNTAGKNPKIKAAAGWT